MHWIRPTKSLATQAATKLLWEDMHPELHGPAAVAWREKGQWKKPRFEWSSSWTLALDWGKFQVDQLNLRRSNWASSPFSGELFGSGDKPRGSLRVGESRYLIGLKHGLSDDRSRAPWRKTNWIPLNWSFASWHAQLAQLTGAVVYTATGNG